MKKLVLFTQINGDDEWNAWSNSNESTNNLIKIEKGDLEAKVYNGPVVLGALPEFNRPTEKQTLKADNFIGELWKRIEEFKNDLDALIGIHFGNGRDYKESLKPWLEHFKEKSDHPAAQILKHFRSRDERGERKPVLRGYSMHGKYEKEVAARRNNLLDWYESLNPDGDVYLDRVLSLLHACQIKGSKIELENDQLSIENGTYKYMGKLDDGQKNLSIPYNWRTIFTIWRVDKSDNNLKKLRDTLLIPYTKRIGHGTTE